MGGLPCHVMEYPRDLRKQRHPAPDALRRLGHPNAVDQELQHLAQSGRLMRVCEGAPNALAALRGETDMDTTCDIRTLAPDLVLGTGDEALPPAEVRRSAGREPSVLVSGNGFRTQSAQVLQKGSLPPDSLHRLIHAKSDSTSATRRCSRTAALSAHKS